MEKKRIRKNKPKRSRKSTRASSGWAGSGMLRMFLGILGLLCLSLLFILGHDVVTQGRMFAARQIEVIGTRHLTESRILAIADITPGVNIFAVNLGAARKRLLSDGWIAEARVGREIPDRLVIRIREHEPMALLDMGEKYILSREGTIIKRWEETDTFALPLVSGLSYSDLPLEGGGQNAFFTMLMQVLRIAQAEKGALSLSRLEKIDVDRALGLTLHANGPVKLARLGFEKYEEKYRRVRRLLAALDRGPSDPALKIMELESDSRIVAGPF